MSKAYVPHTELKAMSAAIKFAVRTGEFTPYPNILIESDCAF
jgi:D-ribose pyranase